MKKFYISKIPLLLIGTVLFSCSRDDIDPAQPEDGCSDQGLIVLNTSFDGSIQANIEYSTYNINNLDQNNGMSLGNLASNINLTYEISTNTSLYDSSTKTHGIIVSRAQTYFKFNTITGSGQEYPLSSNVTAPVILNGNSYVIEIDQQGYAVNGTGTHYNIKNFDINNGAIGSTLPISVADRTFDNISFFHTEATSSATDGLNKLYFLSGTNLITVNTTDNTAQHVDLYPSFSQSDWTAFYGLEYSPTLGLIAIKKDGTGHEIVKINALSGTYTSIISIPADINTEFYSVAYRECDKTYYLTTLQNMPQPQGAETIYFEFDLANANIINTQTMQDYAFGIELVSH